MFLLVQLSKLRFISFFIILTFLLANFTYAAPGNVSQNLKLWFKADAGVTEANGVVSLWADQSGNGYNLNAQNTPILQAGVFNFHPVIRFDTTDRFILSNTNAVTSQNSTIFLVGIPGTNATDYGYESWVTGGTGYNPDGLLYKTKNALGDTITYYDGPGSNPGGYRKSAISWAVNEKALATAVLANAAQYTVDFAKNGGDAETMNPANNNTADNGFYTYFGNWSDSSFKEPFGDVAETIVYQDSALTETQIRQIESYLALKYGLTLKSTGLNNSGSMRDHYVDGQGNSVYNIQGYLFRNNIIGIGKDTSTGLDQRISRSQNPALTPAILTISTDNDFTSSNDQHADTLTDGQYVILGARGTTADPADLQTTGHNLYTHRIKRDWRIENTGGVSNVHLKFDGFNDEWYVFATAPNTVNDYAGGQLVAQLNANGEVAINPTDGMVFTLAKKKTTLTIDDVTVDETAGTVTLTITADEPVSGGFTIDVSTADGTATAGSDYIALTQEIPFAGIANEIQIITIDIINDTDIEGPETFTVSLSNSWGGVTVDASDTATVTINDDDIAVLSVADVSAQESDGQLDFTITVDKAVPGGFTVNVSTVDGTATAGSDYTALTNQAVTFAGNAGESQTVSVTITNDSRAEQDETFTIQLTATHPGVDASATATGTILNDDSKRRKSRSSWRNLDYDKDGCTNHEEMQAGTDMYDKNDYPEACGNKKKEPKKGVIYGCMNKKALNYSPKAQLDDGSCKFKKDEKKTDEKDKTTEDKKVQDILSKSSCPHFTSYQNLGSSGYEVEKIQAFLKKFGFFNREITGYYGAITKKAIKAFQARYTNEILVPWGISSPTGRWYKTTRAKANELMGCNEGKSPEELVQSEQVSDAQEVQVQDQKQEQTQTQASIDNLNLDTKQCPFFTRYFKLGDQDEDIKKIQIFLRKQGLFNYDEATGYYGPITDKAIRAFQAKYKDEILKPWGVDTPTGRWYKTTRAKANELAGCGEKVQLENGKVISY